MAIKSTTVRHLLRNRLIKQLYIELPDEEVKRRNLTLFDETRSELQDMDDRCKLYLSGQKFLQVPHSVSAYYADTQIFSVLPIKTNCRANSVKAYK